MSLKKELRKEYKTIRRNVCDRKSKDELINKYLYESNLYKNCGTLLFYAALDDEVNVDEDVKLALADGKKVALPVCIDNNGKMQYYYIRSLDDIKVGSFGVREPKTDICTLVNDFDNAVCITPAIAFDKSGYRIGYGKGYYDRFLSDFKGVSVGVQYDECVLEKISHDEYDIPVDYLVTQSGVCCTGQGGKNG